MAARSSTIHLHWNQRANMAIADPPYSFFLTVVPQIALAVIVPIIAKTSYGSEFLPGSRHGY